MSKERYINLSDRQVKDTQNQSQDFMSINAICRRLNQQDQQIADLEAKLAESESRFQAHKQNDARIIQDQGDLIELKQQTYQILDDNYARLSEKYDLLESRHELLVEENLKLEQQLAEKEAERELDNAFWKQECDSLQKALAEKQEQYQNAVSNCVNLANKRAILKLKKVQDRIDDIKSKYDCDIEYHLGANNELTHLWEYIDKLIKEIQDE